LHRFSKSRTTAPVQKRFLTAFPLRIDPYERTSSDPARRKRAKEVALSRRQGLRCQAVLPEIQGR
jgi:hypothetical protein